MSLFRRKPITITWTSSNHDDEPRDQQADLFGPYWSSLGPAISLRGGNEFWTWDVLDFDQDNSEIVGGEASTEQEAKNAVAVWVKVNRP